MNEAEAIYRRSFAIVRRELRRRRVAPSLRGCVERLVHAEGSLRTAANVASGGEPIRAAAAALAETSPVVFCDVKMVAAGIGVKTICLIDDENVRADAERRLVTRARAAVRYWLPQLAGSLVVIGNAPTALDELLRLLEAKRAKPPAAIFAFCCGFVGAAAAKRRLIAAAPCPYLTLRGRGGGSAAAAAAVNSITLGRRP